MTFRKKANFSEATFSKDAWFYRNNFLDDVSFDHATFGSGVEFRRTTFKHAYFGYVQFGGPAEFFGRVQELVLTGAEVSVELMMESAAGAVKADNLRGRGRISLRLHGARVDLSGLVFKGPVSVHALQQPLHWDESSSADPVTGVPPVRVVSLARADAERVVLSDVDLTECRFAGMQRMDQLFLDGWCVFPRDPRGLRQVLAEEGYWRAARQSRWWNRLTAYRWMSAPSGMEKVSPARLQVMYRQLRKAVEDAKNEPGAADFYYGEMEMRRHTRTSPWAERAIMWLYWLISGYGLRALRSLVALVILGVIIATALTGWGLAATAPVTTPPQHLVGTAITSPGKPVRINATLSGIPSQLPPANQRWTAERTRTAVEVTLESFVFRSTDQPLTTAGTWTTIAARILGPLLLALSLLAIRNRVKR